MKKSKYPHACVYCYGSGYVGSDPCSKCLELNRCPRCAKELKLRSKDYYDSQYCSCGYDEEHDFDPVLPYNDK